MKLFNGHLLTPVAHSHFGDYLDLTGLIPVECDCVMVMVNTGSGLNAGFPQPVGFLKLSHQIYVKDLEQLIERWHRQRDNPQMTFHRPLQWVTIAPICSKHHLDIWQAE